MPAVPVVTRPSRNVSGARAPGAAVTRPSLRPLHHFGGGSMQSPDATRRGNAKLRLPLFDMLIGVHTRLWYARCRSSSWNASLERMNGPDAAAGPSPFEAAAFAAFPGWVWCQPPPLVANAARTPSNRLVCLDFAQPNSFLVTVF